MKVAWTVCWKSCSKPATETPKTIAASADEYWTLNINHIQSIDSQALAAIFYGAAIGCVYNVLLAPLINTHITPVRDLFSQTDLQNFGNFWLAIDF